MTTTLKTFVTTCVDAVGADIIAMVDASRKITRETFLRHVDRQKMREIENDLGYGNYLRMRNDPLVRYYRSSYRGKPCVYFDWSAIEYVFT